MKKKGKNTFQMNLPDILLYEILTYTNYNRSIMRFFHLCHVSKQWEKVLKKIKFSHYQFFNNIWSELKQNKDITKRIFMYKRTKDSAVFNRYFFRVRHIIILDVMLIEKKAEIQNIVKILKKYFKKVIYSQRTNYKEIMSWYPLDKLIKAKIC
jgi:hypothetical protein